MSEEAGSREQGAGSREVTITGYSLQVAKFCEYRVFSAFQ